MKISHVWVLSMCAMSLAWVAGCKHTAPATQPKAVAPVGQMKSPGNASPYAAATAAPVAAPHPPVPEEQAATPPKLPDQAPAIVVEELQQPPPPFPLPEQAESAAMGVKEQTVAKSETSAAFPSNGALPTWTSSSETGKVTTAKFTTPPTSSGDDKSTHVYSHSDDYRVLVGQVQSWRRGWRLRYADFGAEDQHGGNVTLDGANFQRLQEGSYVRVQGELIPPTDRANPPQFRVQSIEILNR